MDMTLKFTKEESNTFLNVDEVKKAMANYDRDHAILRVDTDMKARFEDVWKRIHHEIEVRDKKISKLQEELGNMQIQINELEKRIEALESA